MSRAEVIKKSSGCAAAFLTSELYKNADKIMLYIPLGNETDTTEIIKRAFADGKKCIFPVTDAASGVITPCYAKADTEFIKGAFSVYEPAVHRAADIGDIDVVIVPGIAFDLSGVRIGFGKGCYDRLLAQTKAVKIGYCYSFQLCSRLEREAHDINMDFLITESGLIACE